MIVRYRVTILYIVGVYGAVGAFILAFHLTGAA